jgi:outer membrane protein assembly factor BamB
MSGRLVCLNFKDGKVLWQKSLIEDFGGTPPMWNFRESPLVDGDRVICTPGASNAMLVALNKISGEVIWRATGQTDCDCRHAGGPAGGGRTKRRQARNNSAPPIAEQKTQRFASEPGA